MPNISLTLPEVSQSVTRPVIFDIINQVQEITKIGKDSKIYFPGDSGKMSTPGSTIDTEIDRSAIFNSNRSTFIEVEEDYDLSSINSTATSQTEHIPIFLDKKLDVTISPVYATSNVTINFKYKSTSKTEILKWRDDIRMRVSMMRDINLNTLTYHYLIPAEYLVLLKVIHANREEFLGYGEELEEYIKNNSSTRLTLIGALVNTDGRLGVSEKQMRIVGIFNFDGLPEKPERDDTNGTWSISFSYRFSYEKPIGCNMKYPVMVHNKLLPKGYVDFVNTSYDLDRQDKSYTASLNSLSMLESDTIMNSIYNPDSIIRIPIFDDYVIPNTPYGTATVFLALAEVDKTDNRTLLNLNELGDIMLDTDIYNYIKEVEYPYIGKIYQSIFHISLYRNDFLAREDALTCTSNLDIVATSDLDLRNQHRVRFSILANLAMAKNEVFDRLKAYPKVFVKVIGSINEMLSNHPDLINLANKDVISNLEFRSIYAIMTGYMYDSRRGGGAFITGNQGNNWPYFPNSRGIFRDIDPSLLEQYRANRTSTNTVQLTGVVAMKQSLLTK